MKSRIFFVLLLGIVSYAFAGCMHATPSNQATQESTNSSVSVENTNTTPAPNSSSSTFTFQIPKKSAHYESNAPEHGSVLPGVPANVVIDFNFDLVAPSNISIMNDGIEYGTGETTIDENLLVLRRGMNPDASDGLYTVNYKACWPDTSCHDGMFQFGIQRSAAEAYIDKTGLSKLSIDMKDIAFAPQYIRVSSGTEITWVNNDSVVHYVNTDSHPAHTFFPEQNSSALDPGEAYSQTFSTPGFYPYHCSAHASTMAGGILVE